MNKPLRIRIEKFKLQCIKAGIELHTVAYIVKKEQIEHMLKYHYGIEIQNYDGLKIAGIRIITPQD